MLPKGCLWLVLGAVVLTGIILFISLSRRSDQWCTESNAGTCVIDQDGELCYCIDTFDRTNSTRSNLSIFNASMSQCEIGGGTLAVVKDNALLISLAKRMFQLGVDNAVVALRQIGSEWLWIEEGAPPEESSGINWREEFPPNPDHNQGMINVETVTIADKESSDNYYDDSMIYYNYEFYKETDPTYKWYGFTTRTDSFSPDSYYICQYYQSDSIFAKVAETSDQETAVEETTEENTDPCYCVENLDMKLSGADDMQTFTTPGYPKNYCSDGSCRWMISVKEGLAIKLEFPVFSTENNMDYVYIFDGHGRQSPLLQTCTGIGCASLQSSGHELQVHFAADHITTDMGFMARVTAVETDTCYCSKSLSVNLINLGDSFTLASPNYPERYCSMHDCLWTITTDLEAGLQLSFDTFQLQDGPDFVRVFMDESDEHQCTGSQCEHIQTLGKQITINFQSDHIETAHIGFYGRVTVVPNYCVKLEEDRSPLLESVFYSEERSDGHIPAEANATITCTTKVQGTFDQTTITVACGGSPVKWARDLDHVCAELCTNIRLEPIPRQDFGILHFCDTKGQALHMVEASTDVVIDFYDLIQQQMLSETLNFTCIGTDTGTSPHKCNTGNLKILMIGGDNAYDAMELFEPNVPRTQLLSSKLSKPRFSHTSALLNDGSVITIGGMECGNHICVSQTITSRCEQFFPQRGTMKDCQSMAMARHDPSSAVLDGVLHVCGGHDLQNQPTSLCERFVSNAWEPFPEMSIERAGFAMVTLDGFLYAIGGRNFKPMENTAGMQTVERYSLSEQEWNSIAPMETRRTNHGAAVLRGYIFVCGGVGYEQFASACECFDPLSGKWSMFGGLSTSTSMSWLLATDRLYILRNYYIENTNTYTNAIEVYDDEKNQWIKIEVNLKGGGHQRVGRAVVIP